MIGKSYRCPGAKERRDWILAEIATKSKKNWGIDSREANRAALARSEDSTDKNGGISTEVGYNWHEVKPH
jgi:hypothetical protein